jgi:SAM-dependent methyltransferase
MLHTAERRDEIPMNNYSHELWPLIYDRYNQGRHDQELDFYGSELAACTGPVLEVACGTGMILLPLLAKGLDIHGFDLSAGMLAQLFAKVPPDSLADLQRRVSQQNMVDFQLDLEFDAVFIPARSFLHLVTQEEQITALRNIHRHLRPDGQLLLNFFTPNLRLLVERLDPNPNFVYHRTYLHPGNAREMVVSYRQINDPSAQIQNITWRFQMGEESYDSLMRVRWIYRPEFELLARYAGFRVAALYGGFDRDPYDGKDEMVWVLEKERER